jgi:DNA-directed RNA polymerase subunit RPC12/RpoP
MALIKCAECGKQVSSEAVACPHCGITREKQEVLKEKKVEQQKLKCGNCGTVQEGLNRRCPKCGEVVRSWGIIILSYILMGGLIIFLGFYLKSCVFTSSDLGGSSSLSSVSSYPDDKYSLAVCAKDFIRDRLKAPSTAKFPDQDAFEIHNINPHVWKVFSYVDSQNSFGALLRTKYSVELQTESNGNCNLLNYEFLNDSL